MITTKGQSFINRSDCYANIICTHYSNWKEKKMNASKVFNNALGTKVSSKIKINHFNNVEEDTSKLSSLPSIFFIVLNRDNNTLLLLLLNILFYPLG